MMRQLLICVFGLLFVLPAFATLPQSAINAGYTEVEYIQSNGTQYIDTGYHTTDQTWVHMKFMGLASGNKNWFGGRVDKNSSFSFGFNQYDTWSEGSSLEYIYGGPTASWDFFLQGDIVGTVFELDFAKNKKIYLDGVVKATLTNTKTTDTNGTLWLFSRYSGSASARITGRLYSFVIYEGDAVMMDMVPAKHGDTVGMYDVKNNRFYESAVSGTNFEAGPAVCNGTVQTYTTATGTVTQSPNPTPSAPVTPTFYTQGGMTLRAVGTGANVIADSYDATTGKITRRVGYKVLDGTEEWAAYSSISGLYYSEDAITNNKLNVPSLDIASTHFAATDSPNLENNGTLRFQQATGNPSLVTTHRLYLRNTAAANVTAFKQWLSQNPVTVWYPLEELYEEDWAATQCTAANTCNNLFDASAATSGYLIVVSNGQPNPSSSSNFVSDYIAVTGGAKYTLNRTIPTATNGLAWYDAGKTYISGQKYNGSNGQTFTAPANAAYARFSIYNSLSGVKFEQGETATEYCTYRGKIKIATTKYNNTAFQPVLTALNNAVSTIKDVVANTINQATAVANLQSDKQRRPNPTDTNGTCPNYRQCLLVEDSSGVPHWYEIMDPFYNLFSAVIPNNVSALSVASASGEFTQLEYIQSNGSQYLDTGITMVATDDIEIRFARNNTSSATAGFFGYMPSGSQTSPRLCFGSYSACSFGGYNVTQCVAPLDTDFHTARLWYEDGAFHYRGDEGSGIVGQYTTPISGTMGTAYIFARHGISGVQVSDGGGTKISYIIWKDVNGNLKAHYVAARRSDGVLGMYDLKTGNFLTNLGSGSFTASTNLASPSLLPNGNSWNATFGANDTYGYGRSIVYGTATCNATSGTANTAATSNQMSNANWTATGNNCWCHIERVDETATGNTGLSTGNIWVWLAVPSGETCGGDCASNCADAVASGAAANKAFRKALTGM